MKDLADNRQSQTQPGKSLFWLIAMLVILVGMTVFIFLRVYSRYTDKILYNERLGQMQEVTEQLFNGLEDVVDNQWYNADVQTNRLLVQQPQRIQQLLDFMEQQAALSKFETMNMALVVVDNRGRYYTQNGAQGLLAEMAYLSDAPDRISFVSSAVTKERTQMFFMVRLKEPIEIQDGEHEIQLTYCGIARDMTELNHYFSCDAYGGKNAVYVLDENGTKLFSGENGSDFLDGFNVYTVLRNSSYLHGSTFENALNILNQNGISYSNAVINGTECYYSLYQMNHAAWILLFMVPSGSVAVNTVSLVTSTTKLVMIFAVCMILICSACIYWLMRRQQREALCTAEENNLLLEANNEKLQEAQNETKQALQSAESASKAKTEFLANMSHDIRTPMNAIVGITKLMEHEQENPEQLKLYIHKLQSSSRHLLSLINDVLDMSKIESSEVSLNREPVNLADQIGQIDSIMRPQVDERSQYFIIQVHQIVHEYLIGDAVRLRQIIVNLVSNAVKYTPIGGKVSVDLEELAGLDDGHTMVRITVKDTGCGMTPEFITHIFEPFTRAENSMTNRVQGTGLGMAITKRIVDLMGGTIEVQSEPGKGSCFRVTLPFEIDASVSYEIEAKKVMLISDDPLLIQNVRASFHNSGIPIDVVRTKAETEALLREQTIDTILLSGYLKDLQLPEMVQFLREKAANAVLIFCVDYVHPNQVSEILKRSGVNDLIARPFFLSNFARVVNQARSKDFVAEAEEGSVLKGRRFLCAEDNALNAEILEAILDMNEATCVIYPNGKELVDRFDSVQPGEYDAILMDVQMPVMNGLDATRAIRRSKNTLGKTIPIIAMTANAFSSDVQACLDSGMDAHISKPLDVAVLERTIKHLVTPPHVYVRDRQ